MYKNYIFLFKSVLELQPILKNAILSEVYTQEKDKLVLTINKENGLELSLDVSVNSNSPFILLKHQQNRAKKNTISFFNSYLPHLITNVSIALFDRVIKLDSSFGSLFIRFKGADSNILFIDKSGSLSAFKKITSLEALEIKNEFSNTQFISSVNELMDHICQIESPIDSKKLPFAGKEIIQYLADNNKLDISNLISTFQKIIDEPINVFYDELKGKGVFAPAFISANQAAQSFQSYFEALNNYFSLSHKQNKIVLLKTSLEKLLNKELEKLASKLNQLKVRVELGSKELLYKQYADLLLSNLNTISKGIKNVELFDSSNNCYTTIALDLKKNPSQNAQFYYDKSRNEKIEFEKSKELYSYSQNKYNRLLTVKTNLNLAEDLNMLNEIKNQITAGKDIKTNLDEKEKLPYRHYLIDGKYHLYVGKDSKNNDQLTTRFAKQNDFWFHARSVAGSHVVLRVDNTKEVVPKSVLQSAASVAAFYSKAKTSKVASVTYTLKKYVNKNQRHEPGQVSVLKENVLLVKPEIPKNVEYLSE